MRKRNRVCSMRVVLLVLILVVSSTAANEADGFAWKAVGKEELKITQSSPSRRKEKNKKKAARSNKSNEQHSSDVESREGTHKKQKKRQKLGRADCRHWLSNPHKKRRQKRYILTAYRMAVLSSLPYWDFHKKDMPGNVSGFRLLNDADLNKPQQVLGRIGLAFRMQLCRLKRIQTRVNRRIRKAIHGVRRMAMFRKLQRRNKTATFYENYNNTTATGINKSLPSCRLHVPRKEDKKVRHDNNRYTFQYWLYNWHETTVVPVVKWHDTDLLVTSSANSLALSFAGTASVADHFTNAQTFEPAVHSNLFHGGGSFNSNNGTTIQGSLHRGFLNAYSRVERGSVLRLSPTNQTGVSTRRDLAWSLDRRYGHCTANYKKENKKKKKQQDARVNNSMAYETAGLHHDGETGSPTNRTIEQNKKKRQKGDSENHTIDNPKNKGRSTKAETKGKGTRGGCYAARGEKLIDVMRDIVTDALSNGLTVHLTGHSQGGALATLLAIDIIVNFPQVPVKKLHLWTFGAPQVADDLFFQSAIQAAPRLERFVEKGKHGRFHRFVTLSDKCEVDFVSTVARRLLPSHRRNLRGLSARRLGGVRGHVVHFADPHYLLTPNQYNNSAISATTVSNTTITTNAKKTTTTSTSLKAHLTRNYVQGISRESPNHPLTSDLPSNVRNFIGEDHLFDY